MRTIFLVAALLAAVALCESTPSYCTNSEYYDIPLGVTYSESATSSHTWCYKFSMNPGTKSYAYVSLRRRTRFNSSGSYLYFCAKDKKDSISSCTFSNSYYNFYAESYLPTVYGRIDYYPYGVDKNGYVYFEFRKFTGSSYSAWSGLCPGGNCRNHGACLYNTSCWCDEGYDGCVSDPLPDWIVYLIVALVLIFVFLPIIIVIICCCCCAACAAGAAAAAAR